MVLPDMEATQLCSPLAKKKICSKSPVPGALQQHLFYGEYSPFKYAPMFESDFIQVTKKGEVLSIHKDITVVTVGVTSTSPSFFLPNVMLLARPINSLREMVCNCRISTDRCPMELTRLFPLCFVNISIHDVYNRQLRLKLANGRAFYLQLYVHPECENEVFERWMKLVALLHNSPENVYGYEAVTPEIECILEQTSIETLATELSDWQLEEPAMSPAMREYYEANRASSRKSEKSEKSEKPEDCSTRTQSKSQKSNSGKAGENAGETENIPDFSQEQEPWPPVKPPEKKKKTQGPIGFNFFKKDKGSKEKSPAEGQVPVPEPVTTPTEDYKGKLKMEGEESEEKDDGKKLDEDKGRKKEKSKGKEGKKKKQKNKDKEKMEKQTEREQQLKEKRQQEKGKKKGREDKGGTDEEWRQREREERRQEKEERQRAREAKQKEKEEKKQRAREERKQREMEEKKRKSEQKDKTKQAKTKGNEEKDMN